MDMQEIAEGLARDHARVEQLASELEQAAAKVEGNRSAWLARLRHGLDEFATCLNHHFDLEEHGGYLQGVLERRPTLARRVERIRHEHVQIRFLLHSLDRMFSHVTEQDNLLIEHGVSCIQAFITYLRRHEHSENDLVGEVWSTDIGHVD